MLVHHILKKGKIGRQPLFKSRDTTDTVSKEAIYYNSNVTFQEQFCTGFSILIYAATH